eukprot:TRINITY_DN55471_c0_g1_i2.p1 TRINITY_DN55471_c0_g1~~TRINITY_DN55471_c0_g1_i2.p1  ORF type:complete len:318 (+),score=17.67 TRINITY_DN55471_c0_g1_i2:46-999(+)
MHNNTELSEVQLVMNTVQNYDLFLTEPNQTHWLTQLKSFWPPIPKLPHLYEDVPADIYTCYRHNKAEDISARSLVRERARRPNRADWSARDFCDAGRSLEEWEQLTGDLEVDSRSHCTRAHFWMAVFQACLLVLVSVPAILTSLLWAPQEKSRQQKLDCDCDEPEDCFTCIFDSGSDTPLWVVLFETYLWLIPAALLLWQLSVFFTMYTYRLPTIRHWAGSWTLRCSLGPTNNRLAPSLLCTLARSAFQYQMMGTLATLGLSALYKGSTVHGACPHLVFFRGLRVTVFGACALGSVVSAFWWNKASHKHCWKKCCST